MNRKGRLQRLERARKMEAAPLPSIPVDIETQQRWQAAIEAVFATIPDEYLPQIAGQWEAHQLKPEGIVKQLSQPPIIKRFWELVRREFAGKRARPIALPGPACEVYLRCASVIELYECEDCGFEIPHEMTTRPSGQFPGARESTSVRHLDHCPLCSGQIGSNAYERKHGVALPTYIPS